MTTRCGHGNHAVSLQDQQAGHVHEHGALEQLAPVLTASASRTYDYSTAQPWRGLWAHRARAFARAHGGPAPGGLHTRGPAWSRPTSFPVARPAGQLLSPES